MTCFEEPSSKPGTRDEEEEECLGRDIEEETAEDSSLREKFYILMKFHFVGDYIHTYFVTSLSLDGGRHSSLYLSFSLTLPPSYPSCELYVCGMATINSPAAYSVASDSPLPPTHPSSERVMCYSRTNLCKCIIIWLMTVSSSSSSAGWMDSSNTTEPSSSSCWRIYFSCSDTHIQCLSCYLNNIIAN